MLDSTLLEDPELGRLQVRVNARARRLTFRTKDDGLHVTVPPGTSRAELLRALEQLRPRLLTALAAREQRSPIDLDYRIDTGFFRLRLVAGGQEGFFSRSVPGEVEIVCPPDARFADLALQAWLRKVVGEALRSQAKFLLLPRLYALARRHGLAYRSVKINSSRGRWGSCSTAGSINLSCFLLLLPLHLIDYVLLHKLAHTREMNHGARFWALLDQLTDGRARELCEELKSFTPQSV